MNKGKVIVIDGLDGCGKSTQFEICAQKLKNQNYKVKPISFPDYTSPSSALVKMYLNGEISQNASDVNSFAASSFYAVDRYVSYKKYWEENYNNGEIILASRYVSSNAIHQMAKLDKSQWDNYLDWLFDYEHNKLALPKADAVIFLDVPTDVSQKLLSNRYEGNESKKDVHESDIEYMKSCRNSAFYAAEKLNWHIINCTENSEMKSIEDISDELMKKITEVINA
jgi:dTMP kinase